MASKQKSKPSISLPSLKKQKQELLETLQKIEDIEKKVELEKTNELLANKKVKSLREKFDSFYEKIKDVEIIATVKRSVLFEVQSNDKIILWDSVAIVDLNDTKEVKDLLKSYEKEYKILIKQAKNMAQSEGLKQYEVMDFLTEGCY